MRSTPRRSADLVLEARGPPATSKRDLPRRVGLPEGGRHLRDVVDVSVLLGDDLADQDGVGVGGAGLGDEFGHEDLGAEIDDGDLGVVLQTLLPRDP